VREATGFWGRQRTQVGPERGGSPGEETAVLLNGVPVEDRLVLELSRFVEPTVASKLVMAYRLRSGVVALTVRERESILGALEDGSYALSWSLREVRDVFLRSDDWLSDVPPVVDDPPLVSPSLGSEPAGRTRMDTGARGSLKPADT
jgi:hypothetical protein